MIILYGSWKKQLLWDNNLVHHFDYDITKTKLPLFSQNVWYARSWSKRLYIYSFNSFSQNCRDGICYYSYFIAVNWNTKRLTNWPRVIYLCHLKISQMLSVQILNQWLKKNARVWFYMILYFWLRFVKTLN